MCAGVLGKLGSPSSGSGLWFQPVFYGAYGWRGTKGVSMVPQHTSTVKARCLITLFGWVNLSPVHSVDSYLKLFIIVVNCLLTQKNDSFVISAYS